MNLLSYIKRSLAASFFLVSLNAYCHINSLDDISVSEENQLRALFHIQDDAPKILDNKFLLQSPYIGFKQELKNNYADFISEETRGSYLCRFPARSLWFSRKLSMLPPSFQHCEELSRYLRSVPADAISVIYASENIVSPSSFMGHSFLKLKDKDDNFSHAVSYFTNVEGFNLPKIMFESLVTGKEGYFIISPYQEAKDYYKDIEGRNVYEYNLLLDGFERELIKLHLWELKDKKIDYYFHTNNCATLTLDILSIVEPSLIKYSEEWLSPLDVIKYINDTSMVKNTEAAPAIGWRVRAFGEVYSYAQRQAFLRAVKSGSISTHHSGQEPDYLSYEYQQALNDWLYQSEELTKKVYEKNNAVLLNETSDYELDLSGYKNPILRSPDSQLAIGFNHNEYNKELLFSWLPASHLLTDDNTNAFSESSLEVLKSTVSINERSVSLHELTLYGIESYIPYDSIVGGWSGKFKLGWERGGYASYGHNERFNLTAALGMATDIHPAMLTYLTFGSEVSANNRGLWAAPQLETGSFMYLAGGSKLRLKYRLNFNELNDSEFIYAMELTNTHYFNKNVAFDIGLAKYVGEQVNESQLLFNYRYYY